MSHIITATDAEVVAPGGYDASLIGIEDGVGQYGPFYDWSFLVAGPDGAVEVSRRTSAKFGPSTIARSFVEALLGRKIAKGEQVDLDSLIGNRCRVKVNTNDNGYSTIEDIAPFVATAAAPAPAAPAAGRTVTMDSEQPTTSSWVSGNASPTNASEVPF